MEYSLSSGQNCLDLNLLKFFKEGNITMKSSFLFFLFLNLLTTEVSLAQMSMRPSPKEMKPQEKTSFDKFYDKKLYDYKNTAKVSSDSIDNGNNIKINDLRAAKNIKLVNYNMSNKVDTSLENSIQVNDLRKNDMNNNNLVKDANYYVKLGKEIAKNNFNN